MPTHGIRFKKIHQILKFNQSPWLRPYIDANTEKRSRAKNEFEKYYYKRKNNSVFGKTTENQSQHVDVKLVSRWDGRYGPEARMLLPNIHNLSITREDCGDTDVQHRDHHEKADLRWLSSIGPVGDPHARLPLQFRRLKISSVNRIFYFYTDPGRAVAQ